MLPSNIGWPFRLGAFGVGGITGFAANEAALLFATQFLGLYYLGSSFFGSAASVACGFLVDSRFAFADRPSPSRAQLGARFMKFALLRTSNAISRTALLFVFTEWFGIYYLYSNAIAVAALFLSNYAVSTRLIWQANDSITQSPVLRYDIYGLVTVLSPFEIPDLKNFLTESIGNCNPRVIRIRSGPNPDARVFHPGLIASFSIEETPSGYEVGLSNMLYQSKYVTYYNVVEPLVRMSLAMQGHLLLHAACIEKEGRRFILVALPDTGKTTSAIELARRGYYIVSDDMVVVDSNGFSLGYHKQMTLSPRTARYFKPDSLLWPAKFIVYNGGVRRALSKFSTGVPILWLNAIVQLIYPPPKVEIPTIRHGASLITKGYILLRKGPEFAKVDKQEAFRQIEKCNAEAFGFPPFAAVFPRLRTFPEAKRKENELLKRLVERLDMYELGQPRNWVELIIQGTSANTN